MGEPTIYFPENLYPMVDLNFAGRVWSTDVREGPNGLRQARPNWFRPKQLATGSWIGTTRHGVIINTGGYNNDPGTPEDLTHKKFSDDQIGQLVMMSFLDQVQGMAQNFYIFDPKPRQFVGANHLPFGDWNYGGYPKTFNVTGGAFTPDISTFYTLPLRGATGLANPQTGDVTAVVFIRTDGSASYTYTVADGDIVLDHGGTNGATRFHKVPTWSHDEPTPDGDFYAYVIANDVHRRWPMEMADDIDRIRTAIDVDINGHDVYSFNMIESFG